MPQPTNTFWLTYFFYILFYLYELYIIKEIIFYTILLIRRSWYFSSMILLYLDINNIVILLFAKILQV